MTAAMTVEQLIAELEQLLALLRAIQAGQPPTEAAAAARSARGPGK